MKNVVTQSTKTSNKKQKTSKNTTSSLPAAQSTAIQGPEDNPHWAYTPPEGARLVDHNVDAEEFDWDSVKADDDLELWVIRAPADVRVLISSLTLTMHSNRKLYLADETETSRTYVIIHTILFVFQDLKRTDRKYRAEACFIRYLVRRKLRRGSRRREFTLRRRRSKVVAMSAPQTKTFKAAKMYVHDSISYRADVLKQVL